MGVAIARPGMMRISPLTITIDPHTTVGTTTAITTIVRPTLGPITKATTIVGTGSAVPGGTVPVRGGGHAGFAFCARGWGRQFV